MRAGDPRVGRSLVALVADEEVDLAPYLARLRAAGIAEVRVELSMPSGVMFEASSAEVAREAVAVISAQGRRFVASESIDWNASTPIRDALDRLAPLVQGFDKVTRYRLAASDMRLAADAARGLIEAAEDDGPARLFDRVIETGMVVTYMRPYLASNEAPVGERLWPKGADRALHDELDDLRNEYHAHAGHTPRRRLDIVGHGATGRPTFAESWSRLSVDRLQAIVDLATRQAERFDEHADTLDREMFGPHDVDEGA
jgi:hypothetical protein